MLFGTIWTVFALILVIAFWVGVIYLAVLLIRALRKYLTTEKQAPVSEEKKQPLSAVLKEYRMKSGMTQEAVAEQLNVSRQAVSKWENGSCAPTTANLFALAKLYGISLGELLQNVEQDDDMKFETEDTL